jgi:hypothetical protein
MTLPSPPPPGGRAEAGWLCSAQCRRARETLVVQEAAELYALARYLSDELKMTMAL